MAFISFGGSILVGLTLGRDVRVGPSRKVVKHLVKSYYKSHPNAPRDEASVTAKVNEVLRKTSINLSYSEVAKIIAAIKLYTQDIRCSN